MPTERRDPVVGITGANGFIGTALLGHFIQAGTLVRALCGPGAPLTERCRDLPQQKLDLNDSAQLDQWADGLDVVVHAAGPPSVRQSFENPTEYVRVHVEGTTTLLESCRRGGVTRFIYLSSAEVYGRPESNPVSECQRLQARSPYAAAKIAAEKMVEAYALTCGLGATILRPFSIYGANPTPESLFGTILSMSRGGSIRLHDLKPIRDYCYVDDLARAVLLACSIRPESLTILNIATGVGTSVAELADHVVHALGVNIPVLEERASSRSEESDIFELIADTRQASTVLGWRAETSLMEGIRRALDGRSISR